MLRCFPAEMACDLADSDDIAIWPVDVTSTHAAILAFR
jgi:hypothetical protein